MANVFDVAEYILNKIGDMTTMKLQKLVYYCQAYSLGWDGVPLFDEEFEAWANGPVCRELFDQHKGDFTISKGAFGRLVTKDPEFNEEAFETMDAIINDYGVKSSFWLSELTHTEDPWRNARTNCSPRGYCNEVVTKDALLQYYGGVDG